MRFIAFVMSTETDDYAPPSVEMVEKMGAYNQKLVDAGVLVDLNGLQPPSRGARVRFGAEAPIVADGPFAEAKELIGGYWVLECASKDEAVDWVRNAPMPPGSLIEVREIFAMEDHTEDVQAAAALEGFEPG